MIKPSVVGEAPSVSEELGSLGEMTTDQISLDNSLNASFCSSVSMEGSTLIDDDQVSLCSSVNSSSCSNLSDLVPSLLLDEGSMDSSWIRMETWSVQQQGNETSEKTQIAGRLQRSSSMTRKVAKRIFRDDNVLEDLWNQSAPLVVWLSNIRRALDEAKRELFDSFYNQIVKRYGREKDWNVWTVAREWRTILSEFFTLVVSPNKLIKSVQHVSHEIQGKLTTKRYHIKELPREIIEHIFSFLFQKGGNLKMYTQSSVACVGSSEDDEQHQQHIVHKFESRQRSYPLSFSLNPFSGRTIFGNNPPTEEDLLSPFTRANIFSILLTCREWYEVITESERFWKERAIRLGFHLKRKQYEEEIASVQSNRRRILLSQTQPTPNHMAGFVQQQNKSYARVTKNLCTNQRKEELTSQLFKETLSEVDVKFQQFSIEKPLETHRFYFYYWMFLVREHQSIIKRKQHSFFDSILYGKNQHRDATSPQNMPGIVGFECIMIFFFFILIGLQILRIIFFGFNKKSKV